MGQTKFAKLHWSLERLPRSESKTKQSGHPYLAGLFIDGPLQVQASLSTALHLRCDCSGQGVQSPSGRAGSDKTWPDLYIFRHGSASTDVLQGLRGLTAIQKRGNGRSLYRASGATMPSSRSLDFKDIQQWSHASSKTPKACLNLELLSGSDRIAAALRRQVKNVISFGVDISQGACLDLTRENIQQVIIKFICRFHEFVWLGTPCNSWSHACRWDGGGPGPLRDDSRFLLGFPCLSQTDQRKIHSGNCLMKFIAKVFRICLSLGIPACVENPHTSRIWLTRPFVHLLRHPDDVSYCCSLAIAKIPHHIANAPVSCRAILT